LWTQHYNNKIVVVFNLLFFIEEFFFYLNLSMYLSKKIVYTTDNLGSIFFSKKKIEPSAIKLIKQT